MGAVIGPSVPPYGVAVPVAGARPPAPRASQLGWVGGWLAGVVLIVVGTFLPWLYSGSVGKNSYQLAGVGQRRLELPAWADALLVGWPLLGPALAVLAALLALRLRRTVAWISMVLALVAGILALLVLVGTSRMDVSFLSAAYAGPLVTAVGALVVVVAAVGLLRLPGPDRS